MRLKTKRQRTDRQITEDRLDLIYSEAVRRQAMRRAKGCQYCGKSKLTYHGLEAAHLHSRGRRTVRWDLRNGAGVCPIPCHRYLDQHPKEKHWFFKKLLGEDEYWKLFQLANMTTKSAPIDYKKIEANLRELLKEN